MSHTVYRFFGDEVLLYVGRSYNLDNRFKKHRQKKPWAQITNITLKHYETQQEAVDVERQAIRDENPLWNVAGIKEAPPVEKASTMTMLEELMGRLTGKYVEALSKATVAECKVEHLESQLKEQRAATEEKVEHLERQINANTVKQS